MLLLSPHGGLYDEKYTTVCKGMQVCGCAPAWALWYEEQGVYAVFLTGITRAKGEQYVQALRQAGFEEGEAGVEDASAGYLLHKGGTVLSAAVSEGQLGIYISPGAAQ